VNCFDSADWWDPSGPFRLLHAWMPLRLRFILEHLARDYLNTPGSSMEQPLAGMKIVDVGCGGGLVSEPLARLGAQVIGIDPSPGAIACAVARQAHRDLTITYVCQDPFHWVCPEPVDAVIVFEVLEHVENPSALIKKVASWVRPGGCIVGSTVNRTLASGILGIGVAEYVLNWVPKGTHAWANFLTPQEIIGFFHQNHLTENRIQGCIYYPGSGWHYSNWSGMNYFFSATQHPFC
jgi:2-polyprenyl-6-hydroxyphenyl methylase/3-demethylubiquinone-9 3-methyltransferase